MPTSYRSRKTTDKKSKTGRKSRKGAATAESKDREQPHCPIFFVEYGPGRKSLFNSACRCNTLLDTVKDICTKALQTAIEARRAEIAGELKNLRKQIHRHEASILRRIEQKGKMMKTRSRLHSSHSPSRSHHSNRHTRTNTRDGRPGVNAPPSNPNADNLKPLNLKDKDKDSKPTEPEAAGEAKGDVKGDGKREVGSRKTDSKAGTAMGTVNDGKEGRDSTTRIGMKLQTLKEEEQERLKEDARLMEDLKMIQHLGVIEIADQDGNPLKLRHTPEEYAYKVLQPHQTYKILRIEKSEGSEISTVVEVNV